MLFHCILLLVIIMNTEKKIKAIIDNIRPYLIADGGNLEFIKFEDGIVYIKMLGACSNCAMIDFTIKDGIEAMLINEIPEVKSVLQVED